MARPISDEELQLKKRARRRLVGAIVLVTTVAVVLPMVLDSEPRSVNQNVDIHIPSPDSGEFKPKAPAAAVSGTADTKSAKGASATPKAESSAAGAKTAATPASSDDTSAPRDKSSSGVTAAKDPPPARTTAAKDTTLSPPVWTADTPARATPATKDTSAEATTATKDTSSQQAVSGGAYVVQVAALSDSSKAKALEKQMAGAGLKTYTEVVNTQSGEVTRVRAGPFATREAAEKARSQLKKAGLDGKVVPK